MNRSKAGARLSAYLEGDLSESERSKLESQLAGDPGLRETLRELEGVVGLLRDLPEAELPPAFAARVMARVQEQREPAALGAWVWLRRIFEPVVAVPLAGGITALALAIGTQQGPDPVVDEAGTSGPRLAASPAPAASSEQMPPLSARPVRLASDSRDLERMSSLTEIQKRTLQTILSRHRHEDLARMLSGSGHPYASSFAREVFETGPTLMMVSHESARAHR